MRYLICLMILVLGAACVPPMPSATQTLRILVVDAESGRPLPQATIDLHYFPSVPEEPDPDHPSILTDDAGMAVVPVRSAPVIWQVTAPDYVEQRQTGENGEPPLRFAAQTAEGVDGIVHLYALPEARVIISVTEGYTGEVIVDLTPAPGFDFVPVGEIGSAFAAVAPQAKYAQGALGTRTFTETASLDGRVALTVTPLLFDLPTEHFIIQDEAESLPHYDIGEETTEGRGVWGNATEVDKNLNRQIRFFVGTKDDYLAHIAGGQ